MAYILITRSLWRNWAFNYYFSGSRSGSIHHHDVRAADHLVGRLAAHAQEVCGLKWSPDGKFLASGGNDNLLHVWKAMEGSFCTEDTPFHTFTDHQAAVKVQKSAKTPRVMWRAFQKHMYFYFLLMFFFLKDVLLFSDIWFYYFHTVKPAIFYNF